MKLSTSHSKTILFTVMLIFLSACSGAKHVPKGSYLLDKMSISVIDSTKKISSEEFINYVRQHPNHKILWSTKLQLGIYNMSGSDTTKRLNRWLRRLGEAPVIYDSALTSLSTSQLKRALENKGYLNAEVKVTEHKDSVKRKIRINYLLKPGLPHIIRSVKYEFSNDSIRRLILRDSAASLIKPGLPLDRNLLETQRQYYTSQLRRHGYYAFAKEFISFNADTTEKSRDVDLTIIFNPPYPPRPGGVTIDTHSPYYVRSIKILADYDPSTMTELSNVRSENTVNYKDLTILYGQQRYLRPAILEENCFIHTMRPYNSNDVDRTYEAFSRLNILKFINILFIPIGSFDGKEWLDAYIMLTPGNSQSVSAELEGTNSEGDLGIAASISYSHRNIGHRSETFTAKIRGAYESLSGNLEGFINNRYMEYSADIGLNFPKFMIPLLNKRLKRKIRASTEFNISMNYQERPEYTRIIATTGWSYKWAMRNNTLRHSFTPIDINYVYLPKSTNDFIDQIAPDNPLLRYSYEDHFIMRMGYTYYYSNKRNVPQWSREIQPNVSTIRLKAEIAGNLLYALSNIFDYRPNHNEDPYKIFGISYSQYFKIEGDYAFVHSFDRRNSIAFHTGLGIAYPYGNSAILPFEKRFYGGGANSVRGWDVRTLGPGCYDSSNSVSDFINQCGDIRFDLSLEYRAKLFWILEGAVFLDAGNIWTIHNYSNQPGGVFKFKEFYKQIAAAYGIGLRLDFNYFLLRLDLGMKAHNPAMNQEPWPLIHPHWKRDSSLHFSIGYPF